MSRLVVRLPDRGLPPRPPDDPPTAHDARTAPNFDGLFRQPLFNGASDEALAAFVYHARWRHCASGETVVDLGDRTDEVFFIIKGAVRVVVRTVHGYEAVLNEMTDGEFFGELAALDGIHRSANVTALVKTHLCVVPAAAFTELVLSSSDIARRLLRILSMRLRAKDEQLFELSALPVRQRLISELVRLSRDRGRGERVVSPPPTQQVLASRIAARRESVSIELAKLARDGLVTVERQGIILRHPEKLRAEVEARLQGTGRTADAETGMTVE